MIEIIQWRKQSFVLKKFHFLLFSVIGLELKTSHVIKSMIEHCLDLKYPGDAPGKWKGLLTNEKGIDPLHEANENEIHKRKVILPTRITRFLFKKIKCCK